jgi:hypothetical protein
MNGGGRLWTETSRSHGENWGSIPHGSAKVDTTQDKTANTEHQSSFRSLAHLIHQGVVFEAGERGVKV